MQDLQSLETQVLIDMLAQHSEEYTQMLFSNDRSEAFYTIETTIYLLQTEINSRIPKADNTSLTDASIGFTDDDVNTIW